MTVFRDLFWFFRQEKKAYITGIIALVIVAFLETIPPKIIGIVIDHIKEGMITKAILIRWMAVLFVVAVVSYVLRYWWRVLIFGSAAKLSRQLRNELYAHFTKMSPSFYQRKRIGDLMAHATNDLQAIQQTAGSGILTLVDSLMLGGFVLATAAELLGPYLVKIFIDDYLTPRRLDFAPLFWLALAYIGVLFLKTFISYFQLIQFQKLALKVIQSLRMDVFTKVHQLGMHYFER